MTLNSPKASLSEGSVPYERAHGPLSLLSPAWGILAWVRVAEENGRRTWAESRGAVGTWQVEGLSCPRGVKSPSTEEQSFVRWVGTLKKGGVLRGAKAEEMRARKQTGQRPLRSSVPAFEQEMCSELPINQDIAATTTTTTTVTTIFFDYMTKKKCI